MVTLQNWKQKIEGSIRIVDLHHVELSPDHYATLWAESVKTWKAAWMVYRNAGINKECIGIKVTRYGKGLGGRIQHFNHRCTCKKMDV